MMPIHIYWNKKNDDVIVPTVSKTEAGYWLEIGPVECASWSDLSSVIVAVQKVMSRGVQLVPTPSRQNFPKHVVLSYAKARNSTDFEKKYEMASITYSPSTGYSVDRYRESDEGRGRVVDHSRSMSYTPNTALEEIVTKLAKTVHAERSEQ